MDKGSTNNIPAPLATEAEADNFQLDPHLLRLLWDEPFFSSVLRSVTKIRTSSISTAGVLAKDSDIKMWWNPAFLASLTPDQVKGLLKHECYHLVFHHTTTRRKEPHVIWNYATDLAINSIIPESELPAGGLIPGKAFDDIPEASLEKMSQEQIDRFNKISDKIASFPKGEASEWYFARLMEDEEVKEAITNPGGDGEGNGMPGMPGNMDDHEGWGEMTDEEADIVKSKIKKVTEAASKDCDRKGQWGSISSDVRKKIRESYQTEIPWQSVLRQFIGYSRRSNRITNVKRLSRKYPGIHPGTHRSYTASIAIYIDQSGSVSDTELALLFGELEGLARHTEFVCYHFDTSVDEESETIWRRGKTPEATRTRSGGTNFSAPSNHANKNSHRFDGYLILTDGWAPDPAHSKIRRGWIITPQGEAQEFMKNEITIKMQKEKDAN